MYWQDQQKDKGVSLDPAAARAGWCLICFQDASDKTAIKEGKFTLLGTLKGHLCTQGYSELWYF